MTLKNRIVQGMARTKLLLTGNAGKIEVAQRVSGQKRAIIQLTGQWFDSIPRYSAIHYGGHVFRLLFLRMMSPVRPGHYRNAARRREHLG